MGRIVKGDVVSKAAVYFKSGKKRQPRTYRQIRHSDWAGNRKWIAGEGSNPTAGGIERAHSTLFARNKLRSLKPLVYHHECGGTGQQRAPKAPLVRRALVSWQKCYNPLTAMPDELRFSR